MPLSIFRREGESSRTGPGRRPGAVRFEALTEEWRISAEMQAAGGLAAALSSALNRGEAIPISEVLWGPIDGSSPLKPAPSIKTIGPADIVVAMAGDERSPLLNDSDRRALSAQRIAYEVILDATPFRITGTVHLEPGKGPWAVIDATAERFATVTRPTIFLGEKLVRIATRDAVLVNRSYVHEVKREHKK